MSPETLAQAPAAPGIPERADVLRAVPQRRYGPCAAAVVGCFTLGSVPRGTEPAR
ncbi:hypothetical protein ABT075_18660 [Streptomyces sp. NPDC002677]|uniref:hypothetical protein n=1 Tax=Streptomyces sp. NPDC002677 TaxID=3154774 RepID=UPI00331D194A